MPLSIPTFSYSTRFFVTSLSCEPSERAEAEGRRPTSEDNDGSDGHDNADDNDGSGHFNDNKNDGEWSGWDGHSPDEEGERTQ